MVPTFVDAHTFCASCKAWFKLSAHAGLTLTQWTMLPSTPTEVKAKFSYCDQIKFNEHVLGTPV